MTMTTQSDLESALQEENLGMKRRMNMLALTQSLANSVDREFVPVH